MRSALQDHVEQSIQRALRLESRLTPEAEAIGSYTSPPIRHLLNNLGSLPGISYLEIGVHRGGTFVAANYRNRFLSSIAIDNWSEFDEDGSVRQEFLDNIARVLPVLDHPIRFIERDCFRVKPEDLAQVHPVNLYFYDGAHDVEAQKRAITYFLPALSQEFIFLVDDYDWPQVKEGTEAGIAEAHLGILWDRVLSGPDWHNGLRVSICKKADPWPG